MIVQTSNKLVILTILFLQLCNYNYGPDFKAFDHYITMISSPSAQIVIYAVWFMGVAKSFQVQYQAL